MRALLAVAAIVGSFLAIVAAKAQPASGPYVFHPAGYCQITSLGSAVSLVTASCSTGAVPAQASIAQICVSGNGIRYRDDGTAPTTSLGIPVGAGSCFQYSVSSGSFASFQVIQQAATATLDISFYN